MQWIFMLAGLVLGALADESLSAGLLGGLIGLALGQTLRLQGLELQNSELRKELLAFAARFEQAGVAVQRGPAGSVWVGPAEACGTVLEFLPA